MSYAGHVLDSMNRLKYNNRVRKQRREEFKDRTSKNASKLQNVYTPKEISKAELEKIRTQEVKKNKITIIKTLLFMTIITLIAIILLKLILFV